MPHNPCCCFYAVVLGPPYPLYIPDWAGPVLLNKPTPGILLGFRVCTELGCLVALQAKPNMVKSTVVDNDTGKSIDSTVRTSTGTFFGREVRHFQA
jgi:hypothetical protein